MHSDSVTPRRNAGSQATDLGPPPGPRLRVASIWAQDRNGVLGDGHGMLWHVPEDFKHFKAETIDCPVIMGRSSFQALGKPLPRRLNIVLSRDPGYEPDGAVTARSLDQALEIARNECERTGARTIWITGGAQVYRQAMPLADELVVTELDLEVPQAPGRQLVHAPPIDLAAWQLDPARSDLTESQGIASNGWRSESGDARWRIRTYTRR